MLSRISLVASHISDLLGMWTSGVILFILMPPVLSKVPVSNGQVLVELNWD